MIIDNIQVIAKLLRMYVWNKQKYKTEHMCIGREEENNILSYVDFLRLCNVINQFPGLSIDILKICVNFLSCIAQETVNGEKMFSLYWRNM